MEVVYAWTSQNVPPLSVQILIDLSGTFLFAMTMEQDSEMRGIGRDHQASCPDQVTHMLAFWPHGPRMTTGSRRVSA